MPFYVVDRLEGRMAVVVGDDGRRYDVPRQRLPRGAGEGSVLRVAGAAPPDWARAVIDDAERERRLKEARDTLRRLEETDSGGNVKL